MRAIARFFVDRWQLSLVLVVMLFAIGFSAFTSIPKSEDPIAEFPVVAVTVILPGADAEEMERLVAVPLEQALGGLEDVSELESVSRPGAATVTVEFIWGTDPKGKYDEVIREVTAARATLPDGVSDIRYTRGTTSNAAVTQMALVSEGAALRRVEALSRDLRDELLRAPGVLTSEIFGTPETEVQVALDLAKLTELKIPPQAVSQALNREGAPSPIGAVESGGRRFNVQTSGFFDSLDEIRAVPLRSADGRVVSVGDVASVSWGSGEDTYITRHNGERAIFVTARALLGEDVFAVRNGVYKRAEAFAATLPPDVRLEYGFDQSRNVAHRLGKLGRDFAIAIALVLLTLLPLGLRASLVVMMSIPLSLAVGMLFVQWLGYSLNQLSITGFVIALGLLVDDSIVVTENIARRLREGLPPREAALRGVEEIDVAVIGCTATLMFAFLPLLFLPEASGEFIRSLPVAVLATVGASLVISLTVIPFLASRMLNPKDSGHTNPVLERAMAAIHTIYRPALHVALEKPRLTVAAGLALCGLSMASLPAIGFSLFPETDAPQFMVEVDLPQGAALSETDEVVRFVENTLAAEPSIAWTMANIGRNNPQIYYNYFPSRNEPSFGAVYASFKEWDPNESPEVIARLRETFEAHPGAKINLRRFENGPPISAPIEIRVSGADLGALTELAAEVERVVLATPGARDVVNPLSQRQVDIDLAIDPGRAAVLGVAAGAADQALRIAIAGDVASTFIDPAGDAYPVRVRLPFDGAAPAATLDRLYVWTQTGDAALLSEIAEPRLTSGPARIDRYDRQRTASITAFVQDGFLTSSVTREIREKLANLSFPPGYAVKFGGQAEAAADSFGGLGVAILIATFGILAILLLEFRTFAQMTVVAFVIPFGIAGGVAALLVSGYPLSFVAAIGFVALIGIEIKNSILLVDFANKLRAQGVALKEAVESAGEVRFLPVLLTSLTAIGGLTPLVLEQSPLFSPLAVVIIGGLLSSTLLARIVTPAMYLLLAPKDVDAPAPDDASSPAPVTAE